MIESLQRKPSVEKIESGGANVKKYDINVYKKTYNKFSKKEYDDVNPFNHNDDNMHYNKECKYLKLLFEYDITPKILEEDVESNCLVITDCGERLTFENCPSNWKEQFINIYNILKKENIYHNDIKIDNFTVLNNKIYLIDFGWSSQNIPSYPYFNLNLDIIEKSNKLNELFHNLFNKSSVLVTEMSNNLNDYINSLKNK
tara:strand:+ start:585 stop:1184 length:600 start_codon:yes stop_codon:yes gene_type:complete